MSEEHVRHEVALYSRSGRDRVRHTHKYTTRVKIWQQQLCVQGRISHSMRRGSVHKTNECDSFF